MSIIAGCVSNTISNGEHQIDVNGVSLVYEVSGAGNAGNDVILLHGNGGSHHDLDTLNAQMMRAGYRVFAIDSRGQGANAPLDEYHYADMAEDVYQFCSALNITKPVIYGWSDGGIIALMLELAHPGTTSVMAISGANISVDCGEPKDWDALLEGIDREAPLVQMMFREPEIDPATLSTIKCPVLVCAGEHDLIREDHTRLIADNIPNSTLCILQGEDHGSYIWHNPKMGELLLDFLNK